MPTTDDFLESKRVQAMERCHCGAELDDDGNCVERCGINEDGDREELKHEYERD